MRGHPREISKEDLLLFLFTGRLVLEFDHHRERSLVGLHHALCILFVPAEIAKGEFDELELELLLGVVGDRGKFLEHAFSTAFYEVGE